MNPFHPDGKRLFLTQIIRDSSLSSNGGRNQSNSNKTGLSLIERVNNSEKNIADLKKAMSPDILIVDNLLCAKNSAGSNAMKDGKFMKICC
jgi:hypothetical protein